MPRLDVPPVSVRSITPGAVGAPRGHGVTGPLDTSATAGTATPFPATRGVLEGRVEAGSTPDTLFLVTGDGHRLLIQDPARVAELRSRLGSTIAVTGERLEPEVGPPARDLGAGPRESRPDAEHPLPRGIPGAAARERDRPPRGQPVRRMYSVAFP